MPPADSEEAAPLNGVMVELAVPEGFATPPEVALAKPLEVVPVAYGGLKPRMSALKMLTTSSPTLLKYLTADVGIAEVHDGSEVAVAMDRA